MSLVELDKLIRERQSILSWLKNAELKDSQSGRRYSLRLDVNGVQAMYCGQAYAGAKNYHDAPDQLNAAIKEAIERHKDTLVKDASTARLAQLDAAIRSLKKQAEEVFASVECKGIEIEPGVFSGCDAAKTGASDCPSCGGNQ